MDDSDRRRFVEALERKEEQNQQSGDRDSDAPASVHGGEREDERSTAPAEDQQDDRAKSSRHGKVTADKWNQ